MKIILQSVPLSKCRNANVGDWRIYKNGTIKALSATMDDERSEIAVALHEMLECWLCYRDEITDEEVTKFDAMFEEERERGMHGQHDEAGDDNRACYYKAHQLATLFEKDFCRYTGLPWSEHENNVNRLFDA